MIHPLEVDRTINYIRNQASNGVPDVEIAKTTCLSLKQVQRVQKNHNPEIIDIIIRLEAIKNLDLHDAVALYKAGCSTLKISTMTNVSLRFCEIYLGNKLGMDYRARQHRSQQFSRLRPDGESQRTGLTILNCQPLHFGHTRIINKMIQFHKTVIVGLGSSNKPVSDGAYWTDLQRVHMLRNVYGNRLKIVLLDDIEEESSETWINYVFDTIDRNLLPTPTDLYVGSRPDGEGYLGTFWNDWVSSPALKNELNQKYFVQVGKVSFLRRLIYVDNERTIPKTKEIRDMVLRGDESWQGWVPPVNYPLLNSLYNAKLRQRSK